MKNSAQNHYSLRRIAPAQHAIDDHNLCQQARFVVEKLLAAGYQAYLVGGCVRDLLLGFQPKDFDVATDARPRQICALFRNSRIIGRRFRIVHVYFNRQYIEVSTFRAQIQASINARANGRILRDNTFGTLEEDARRRDFSINAMYYDVQTREVLDFCNGWQDLENRLLRMIGDAQTRYREDPVRLLRALRFGAKLNLAIAPDTQQPITDLITLLKDIPGARLFDEMIKLFHSGRALQCYQALLDYNLLAVLFPLTDKALAQDQAFELLIYAALENTDARIAGGKSVNPAFIFAVLLWRPYLQRLAQYDGIPHAESAWAAGRSVVLDQSAVTSIPKRFSVTMCEIWKLQNRFLKTRGLKALRLLDHSRFRAAYDFMCLRAGAGEIDVSVCQWWTRIQTASPSQQRRMTEHQQARQSST